MAAATIITSQDRQTDAPSRPALPPSRAVVDALFPEDREALSRALTEPADFMDHPDLHVRGTEQALFGRRVRFGDAAGGCRPAAPPPVTGSARKSSASIPTLTLKQERTLFLRLNYSRMRTKRVLDSFAGKALTATAAHELLGWFLTAQEIREQIVQLNMPLVLAMAKRTRLNSIDYNELISEGNMALLRCVDKFDCGRGYKFSTYSCRAILKSFSRVAMRASRYRGRFPAEFDPALEADTYAEKKREDLEGDCIEELKRILLKNLAGLSDVESTVIRARFALNRPEDTTPKPATLEEVGSMIGVTKERVRQIQNKALRKIRLALEEGYLAA